MDDDELDPALLEALEESAKLHQTSVSSSFLLSSSATKPRKSYKLAQTAPEISNFWKEKGKEGEGEGEVIQMNVFQQFHSYWLELIKKYDTASAICGYASAALAVLISRLGIDTYQGLEQLRESLEKKERKEMLSTGVEDMMKFIMDWRKNYINTHKNQFYSKRDENNYVKNWVANYEISDYLKVGADNSPSSSSSSSPVSSSILFFRYNEWVEIQNATHEEKDRITQDDQPFGGKKGKSKGLVSAFSRGEHMFIVEAFHPRRLLTPPQALQESKEREWRVGVVDLNGHYCCCVKVRDGRLVLLNTTEASYLPLEICALADIILHPKE